MNGSAENQREANNAASDSALDFFRLKIPFFTSLESAENFLAVCYPNELVVLWLDNLPTEELPNASFIIQSSSLDAFLSNHPEVRIVERCEEPFESWQDWHRVLIERYDDIFEIVEDLSEREVASLESARPKHPFGAMKAEHMEVLAGQIARFAFLKEMRLRDALLLSLVARSHDLGRHREPLLAPSELPLGGHAELSVQMLEEAGVPAYLSEEDWLDLREAVYWHAQKTVRTRRARARELCYILRDLDKVEIFRDDSYFSAAGIANQLQLHMPGTSSLAPEQLAREIAQGLAGDWSQNPESLQLRQILCRDVSEKALNSFSEGRPIDKSIIRDSYPDYMLYQLAMIFDVHSSDVLEQMIPGVEQRIGYLRRYSSPEVAGICQNILAAEYGERVSGVSYQKMFSRLSAAEMNSV